MIGYHLMCERWALEALRKRRLKVALLDDMNDPFELLAVDLRDKEDRKVFRRLKSEMHRTIGVLCFTRSWSNPVLWRHYGDRHRGICLGFELLDEWVREVRYSGTRIQSEVEQELGTATEEDMGLKLLTTKFKHWEYEDEVRIIVRLQDIHSECALHFLPFCNALRLREVVTGPRCASSIAKIRSELAHEDRGTRITKARLAFRSFRVVGNRAVQ